MLTTKLAAAISDRATISRNAWEFGLHTLDHDRKLQREYKKWFSQWETELAALLAAVRGSDVKTATHHACKMRRLEYLAGDASDALAILELLSSYSSPSR